MDSPKYVVTFYTGFKDAYGADIFAQGEGKTIEEAMKDMQTKAPQMIEYLSGKVEEMQSGISSLTNLGEST